MQALYYEAHVTIEPVFEDKLEQLKELAGEQGFRVAELLLQKRRRDRPERSKYDSFCTGRSHDLAELRGRMLSLVQQLEQAGLVVWRYKLERTELDSRYDDSLYPLDRSQLPPCERHPKPPV